jgi:Streptomyces sporulation and cell division protein, SsgA
VVTEFTRVLGDGRAVPVQTELEWNPKEPYAITIQFLGYRAVWMVSRELVLDALTCEQAGEGDVLFAKPQCTCCVRMELESPSGYAKFLVPRDCLVEILVQTAFLPCADQAAEVERWLAEVTL